jgi:cell division protein ZapA (FtsZ GTPase activity inhibitor)
MGEMVHKVTVRIADVTYTLVSSEPEASIQRAVDAAERLVEAVRAANPSLSLSAGTVLALVNATGDRERLVDELAAGEERLRERKRKLRDCAVKSED